MNLKGFTSPSLLSSSKSLLLASPALLPLTSEALLSLTSKALLLSSPSLLLPSVSSLLLNSLNSLEEHNHLLTTDSAVSVLITLLDSLPNILVIIGRSHAHLQTEVLVGMEEFLTLKLSSSVLIISLEDHLNMLLKSLVVVVVPSSGIVNLLIAVHLVEVVIASSPSVAETAMSSESLLAMVAVVSVTVMSVVSLN